MPNEDKKTETIVYTVHKRDCVDWMVAVCFFLGGIVAALELVARLSQFLGLSS